jgi:hypothetical protein
MLVWGIVESGDSCSEINYHVASVHLLQEYWLSGAIRILEYMISLWNVNYTKSILHYRRIKIFEM